MTDVIRIENVTYAYNGIPAVENATLSVAEGEFLGLVGPNGSGKTTLLKLILGILEADSGEIAVFGEPVTDFDAGERIGYVPQQSSRKGRTMPVTVREVVTMGRFPDVRFGWLGSDDWEKVEKAMQIVGISTLADRRVSELSGGQRQRAFIARALASGADLLALDEPTVGVDAESRAAFFSLLTELNERGITIVLIEHDLTTVTEHAHRIACINRTIHYDGRPSEFIQSDARSRAYSGQSGRTQPGYTVEHVS